MAGNNTRKIRYAVVGAGNIAQVAVLPAFEHAKENSELIALISGDAEKRSELRAKYNLSLVGDYSEFEAILERGAMDAVYIATPNSLHKEYTLRAAKAGVHVLCEKPLAPDVADCEAMQQACAENEVLLMVAYRLHFEEGTLSALDAIGQGKIGQPRAFSSVFGHTVRAGDIRTQPDLGGGATLDLGVYCVNAARHVFRAEPSSVVATSIDKGGVDDTMCAILRFSGGRTAQFTISNSCASVGSYRILGTDGDLRVEPGYEYAEGLDHFLTVDGKTHHVSFDKSDQFAPQLVHFSASILGGVEAQPDAAEGIADVRVVEAILASARTGKVVELPAREYIYHPRASQRLHKPAVRKQETTNAPPPSIK